MATKPRPVREREKLLLDVDLSKEVSEDLRIDTPKMLAGLSGLASTGPKSVAALAVRTPGSTQSRRGPRTRRMGAGIATRRPAQAVVSALAHKIRRVVPEGDDVVFTLAYESDDHVGDGWYNYCESPFWLATPDQVYYAVDEWANAEYEHISESFYNEDGALFPHPDRPGHTLHPTLDQLLEAWDEVVQGDSSKTFPVEVWNPDLATVESYDASAHELMAHYGVSFDSLFPTVVYATELLEHDLRAIENDEEVYLDRGYVVAAVDTQTENFPIIHIIPK